MKTIGERMKNNYELPYLFRLPLRIPVIIRLDGKNFHSFTKKLNKPFDVRFMDNMALLAKYLCDEIQCAEFAFVQSDEISILLHNYKKLESQSWFNNEIQKIVSVSAGLASSFFSLKYKKEAIFDSRIFIIPEAEIVNYFIWRQVDAIRNSISMVANSLYSHKQLHKKSGTEKQEMIFAKGQNWNDYPVYQRRGFAVKNNELDLEIPDFRKDRKYIQDLLGTIEDLERKV